MTPCVSGKHPYATAADAQGALLSTRIAAALHGNTKRREQRCYACPHCGHWHLSSSSTGAAIPRQGQ